MKKKIIILIAMILVAICSFMTSAYSTEAIKLKFANYFPLTHKHSLIMEEFTKRLNKDLAGKAEITYYGGGTLLTAPKMAAGLTSGIADIGLAHVGYTRGRFPVMEIFGLPIGCSSPWIGTHVVNDFYAQFKIKEWDNYHPLIFSTSSPTVLQTIAKEVKTLDDIKGLKIRSTGRVADIVKALGAVPVPIEMMDMYESLRRGVIDGNMAPMEQLKGWKTGELIKNVTTCWKIGSMDTFYVVMSKKKWDMLPADVQKIITNVSVEYKEKWAYQWNEIDLEGAEFLKSQGGKIINLNETQAARWIKATEPVVYDFKKNLVSKGYKAEEIDRWLGFIKERIAYWQGQEKLKKIPTAYKP